MDHHGHFRPWNFTTQAIQESGRRPNVQKLNLKIDKFS